MSNKKLAFVIKWIDTVELMYNLILSQLLMSFDLLFLSLGESSVPREHLKSLVFIA